MYVRKRLCACGKFSFDFSKIRHIDRLYAIFLYSFYHPFGITFSCGALPGNGLFSCSPIVYYIIFYVINYINSFDTSMIKEKGYGKTN